MGVKILLNNNKIQDVGKLQEGIITNKNNMFNTLISRKNVGFKNNIKKYGLIFHYNTRADPMLGICYVDVIRISCIYYSF